LVELRLATAVALACSPSVRHSPTWHQHEGNIRTCWQQVLQERLAIGCGNACLDLTNIRSWVTLWVTNLPCF